jgi:CheY-like chemotaxis protein
MTLAGHKPFLVIEDNDQDFLILEMCLRNVGVKNPLKRYASGREIETYLRNADRGEAQIPVFIFLDLNLPGTDGHMVLAQLKKHATLAKIPVVVLTTSSRERDVESSYQLGASGFLTKPIDLTKFEIMIKQVADYWFSCVKLPEPG